MDLLRLAEKGLGQGFLRLVVIRGRELFSDFNNLVREGQPLARQAHLHRLVLIWPHSKFEVVRGPGAYLAQLLDPFEEVLASVLGHGVQGVAWREAVLHALVPLDAEGIDSASFQLLNFPHQLF